MSTNNKCGKTYGRCVGGYCSKKNVCKNDQKFSSPEQKNYDAIPRCLKKVKQITKSEVRTIQISKGKNVQLNNLPAGTVDKNLPSKCGKISNSQKCGSVFGRCRSGYCSKSRLCVLDKKEQFYQFRDFDTRADCSKGSKTSAKLPLTNEDKSNQGQQKRSVVFNKWYCVYLKKFGSINIPGYCDI